MGKSIVTEADRQRTPPSQTPQGRAMPKSGQGQKVSQERGVSTRNKKSPGKRPHQGG